ncbi:iron chelate uptake ABC transporter family permease subunit [Rhodococcus aerolatus]
MPTTHPAGTAEAAASVAPVVPGVRRRRLLGLGLLVVVLVGCVVLGVTVGARPTGPGEVWRALTAPTGSEVDVVVRSLRVPRTVLALLVGAALGVAGALIQGHTRNPLADPGLLGVSAGAALAVVLAITLLGVGTPAGYLWFSFAGALLASLVVLGVSAAGGRPGDPLTLALAGAAVSTVLGALTSALVLLDTATLDGYRFWVVGSVAGRGSDVLGTVAPFLVLGLLAAVASTPSLNVASLGEDVARSLGQGVLRARLLGVVVVTVLTGAATAACGPVGFVGLVAPHVARLVTGPDHRWLVPYAGLLGAALLLAADVLGRVVVRPGELQVGIVLAVVGAPVFIALVRRRRVVRL